MESEGDVDVVENTKVMSLNLEIDREIVSNKERREREEIIEMIAMKGK